MFRVAATPPARVRRSDGPAHARNLRGDHAAEKRASAVADVNLGPHQQHDAAEADDEAGQTAKRNALAVGHQRVDADHPERRGRDQHGREPARHRLFRQTTAPLPNPSRSTPNRVSAGHSRGAGIFSPRSFSTAISNPPAAIHRSAAISSGGIVSSEILIARYVVPQIRQTAIQAAYARAASGFGIRDLGFGTWDSGFGIWDSAAKT